MSDDDVEAMRAAEIFARSQRSLHERTDRLFAWLMAGQWFFTVLCAVMFSPQTWVGSASRIHIHVLAATGLGGMLAIPVLFLAWRRPGEVATRYSITIAQALFSALLIHVMGGRIETHFHIFGSLAFLAFYRDGRIILLATLLLAIDHFFRGWLWPESVFGLAAPERWRWIEHTGWMLFEDVFLIWSCRRGVLEMKSVASRQAELERVNARIEHEVELRTAELRVARDQALDAVRLKSEFLANMSHEIRTPLNGILGFVQLLSASKLETEQREFVATIEESGETLLTVLNDILDFSKIEAGQLKLEHIEFDPARVIEGASALLTAMASAKDLDFVVETHELRGCVVVGDPTRLRQVLLNLIGNAIKFTESGGVSVRAASQELDANRIELVIEITDTGIGISNEARSRIFQAFSQADGSTTRRFGGTGLGLSICRRLVELMEGSITLVSEPGCGSTFTVRLELQRGRRSQDGSAISDDSTERRPSRARSLRVLVADDNPVNQRVISAMLRHRGHVVDVASDGASAFRAHETAPYDLVFMDAQMPVMDGFSATRAIRAREMLKGTYTPIIALTAHAMLGYRDLCFAAGMDDYLTKPIEQGELDRVLAKVQENSATAKRLEDAPA